MGEGGDTNSDAARAVARWATVPRPVAKRPVLVVDDSSDDLFFALRALQRVQTALPVVALDNGDKATNWMIAALMGGVGRPMPAVIFCDLKMPLGGFEVLEWMGRQPELAGIPFFVLSSSAEPRDVVRARASGATGYLVKVPSNEVFREIVEAVRAGEIARLHGRHWPQ